MSTTASETCSVPGLSDPISTGAPTLSGKLSALSSSSVSCQGFSLGHGFPLIPVKVVNRIQKWEFINVTIYKKTQHMGFFMKIPIVLLVVLVTCELAVVQILEWSPPWFFFMTLFSQSLENIYFEKIQSKRVAIHVNEVSIYLPVYAHALHNMRALHNNQLITRSTRWGQSNEKKKSQVSRVSRAQPIISG